MSIRLCDEKSLASGSEAGYGMLRFCYQNLWQLQLYILVAASSFIADDLILFLFWSTQLTWVNASRQAVKFHVMLWSLRQFIHRFTADSLLNAALLNRYRVSIILIVQDINRRRQSAEPRWTTSKNKFFHVATAKKLKDYKALHLLEWIFSFVVLRTSCLNLESVSLLLSYSWIQFPHFNPLSSVKFVVN